MAKAKKGSWSPDEVSKLTLVRKDSNATQSLRLIAKKLGRSYGSVWQKWHTMTKDSPKVKKATADEYPDIEPMVFKSEPNFVPGRSFIDDREKASFIKGLPPELEKLRPNKGGFIIPTRMERVAKEYFRQHTSHGYVVSTIKGNNKERRVYRKY